MRLTAIKPSTKAMGTPASSACSSVTRCTSQDEATAAGSVATASTPTVIPAAPRLLLDIGAAVGGRRDRTPDHAGNGDQRQDVGQGLEQDRGGARVGRQPVRERGREAEQERRAPRAERPPVAED